MAFLVAVAATPYPGSYWAVAVLAAAMLVQAASVPGPLRVGRSLVLVVCWLAATTLWSAAPSLTLRNVALLALVTCAAALLPRVLGRAQALRALAGACKVLLVASWGLYLLVPSVGRTQEAYQYGTFEGVFVQRNVAAFFCVVAIITFLVSAAASRGGGARRSSLAWASAGVLALLATSSGTGLAVLLASVGVTVVLIVASRARSVRGRRLTVTGAILPAVVVAAWLPFNLGVVSELFGRDATLTGRSVIWDVVERVVVQSPWLGQGSGALWVQDVPVTDAMWAQAGFAFYHAHSAYLDHLAQAGIVGLALVLGVVLLALRRSVHELITRGDVLAMWPAGTLICLLFYGIDEQSFASWFGWLLVVLSASFAAPPAPSRAGSCVRSGSPGAPVRGPESTGAPATRPIRSELRSVGRFGRTVMEDSHEGR
jgi:exopolysaccharide production protein ExoQ